MILTKKKAISIAIELWAWVAETGKAMKYKWPGWEKYGYMISECPLCEYANRHSKLDRDFCFSCPYYKVFGYCCGEDTPTFFDEWDAAETVEDRKKYANLFLEQLKQL